MAEYKGFDPSSKKLKQARKQGQVLKAPLAAQSLALSGILLIVFSCLNNVWLRQREVLEWCLSGSSDSVLLCAEHSITGVLCAVVACGLVGVVLTILVESLQVRLEFHWEPLAFRLDRCNPASGFQKMFKGVADVWLIALKLVAIVAVSYGCIASQFSISAQALLSGSVSAIDLHYLSSLCFRAALFLLLSSGIEYLRNRRRFVKEHSMSHDEVRREYKEDEGDPHVKSHRKALHEAMITQELTRRVRASKVIIVEPAE